MKQLNLEGIKEFFWYYWVYLTLFIGICFLGLFEIILRIVIKVEENKKNTEKK